MKKFGKILCLCVVLFLLASPLFSQVIPLLSTLDGHVNKFSEEVAKSLPFNSTMGLNWSHAYIGQLLGFPPKFGIGATIGFTFLNAGSMDGLMNLFDVPDFLANLPIGLPLPGYVAEARVGGIVLPFDIGFKIGYLAVDKIPLLDNILDLGIGLDYLLIGADLRYSLLPKLLPVKLSVGVGVNRLVGGISKTLSSSQSFGFEDYQIDMDMSKLALQWKTTCVELKVQVSANLLIITPYAGVGASYSWSEAGYRVNADVSMTGPGGSVDNSEFVNVLRAQGFNNMTATEDGMESIIENNAFNIRAYGGLSLNLTVFKFDLTVMYNITTNSLGGTFGIRFQL